MHEHDLDLIAALADGSASDEALARSLVETCPVCRAEYEAQIEVIAWLGAAPRVAMTDLERAGLHRTIRAGVEGEKSSAAVTPWWQRLGYVAAGLLVAAGLVGVLQRSDLIGGSDQGALATATTTAEAADGGSEAPTEGVPFMAGDAAEESAPPSSTAPEALGTLSAAESQALPFAELAEEARAGRAERVTSAMSDEDTECLTRLRLDHHVIVRDVEVSGITYLVVMPEDPNVEDVVIFIELPTCRIVHEDR
jgi:hypothetical protein